MTTQLEQAARLALEALDLNNAKWKALADSRDAGFWKAEDQDHYIQANEAITALHEALSEQPAQQCNPHPKAPHGFMRDASHSADRYVCECEGWDAYDAGYQAGYEECLKRQDALDNMAENARELGLDYEEKNS